MDKEQLYQQIEEYCEKNLIMGMLRITIGDEVVYRQSMGYADVENQIPFTEESMFTLYSLSKPFCAIGLLKLKDRGLVDLDKHPSKYIPEAAGLHERVTIRHLLHHISGLPDFEQNRDFAEKYAPGYGCKVRDHLKELVKWPSYFAPGTGAMYANVNFVLCALIIENVTGVSYADYMNKEVFATLGMPHAVVDNENLAIENRVKGYEMAGGQVVEREKSHNWLLGAGDIVGAVDDVYCLNKAIKHRLLLKDETWEEVLTPSSINNMGMGCAVSQWHGKQRITHNGGHLGFRTLHIQLPEDDFDLIFLSNSGFGDARWDISEMVYRAFYVDEDTIGESTGETVEMDKGYIL